MENKILEPLSSALQKNDLEFFTDTLEMSLEDVNQLVDESCRNIYHELASSSLHERYVINFFQSLQAALKPKIDSYQWGSLLNQQEKSQEGFAPLHLAIMTGKQKLARALLDIGADPKVPDKRGKNSLHYSSETGKIPLFLYIYEKYDISISTPDTGLQTPLHLAINERREDMALVIISIIPEFNINEDLDRSLLELAVRIGSYRITKYILFKLKSTKTTNANLLRVQKICEDKDILRLIVFYNQKNKYKPAKSYSYLVALVIIWTIKEAGVLYIGKPSFSSLSSIKNDDSIYIIPSILLFILCTIFIIGLSFKDPGYYISKSSVTLFELYSKYNPEFVCSYCKNKKDKLTKHCFACNKCIREHDHHCIWINNCVGRGNHRYFVGFLILSLSCLIYEITIGVLKYYKNIIPELFSTEFIIFCVCFGIDVVFTVFLLWVILKQMNNCKKSKENISSKALKHQNKVTEDKSGPFNFDSISDTESMLLVTSKDTNSDISSMSSSLLN